MKIYGVKCVKKNFQFASRFSCSFAAVHFAISESATTLPKKIKYSLRLAHEVAGSAKRWRTENTYPGFQSVGPRTGFVHLQ